MSTFAQVTNASRIAFCLDTDTILTDRGPLVYAKLKACDWSQANFRLRSGLSYLVLDHLDSERAEMEQEAKRLYMEVEKADSKDVREELNGKIRQLMGAAAKKTMTYCMLAPFPIRNTTISLSSSLTCSHACADELLVFHHKVKDLEIPSKRNLGNQREFESKQVLAPGMLGNFSNNDGPQDDYRSQWLRDPLLIWSDELAYWSHKIAQRYVSVLSGQVSPLRPSQANVWFNDKIGDPAGATVTQMSRRNLNPPAFVLLAVTLALLFVAPMPISLFQVLSVQWTFVLLVIFEMIFTAFFLFGFRPRFDTVMLVSIAYGGLMWSTASNWIAIE